MNMDNNLSDITTQPTTMLAAKRPLGGESHTALDSNPADKTTITSSTTNDDSNVLSLYQSEGHVQTQDNSPLFRLSPELRNIIYKDAFDGRDDECGWDEEHECPKINLVNACRNTPSNELLRTCHRINSESRAFFVEAQREFWSNTTFTFTLAKESSLNFGRARFPEHLRNEQISSMARIVINIIVKSGETLTIVLMPTKTINVLGDASWYANRTENYKRCYADKLDSLQWLVPVPQNCHAQCLPLLTYEDARARVRYVTRWNGPCNGLYVCGNACAVCSKFVGSSKSRDWRSDLMVVAACICDMFGVTL